VPYVSSPVPTLETERLRLRGHRVEDLDASAAMWSDPKVVRHVGGRLNTREECWSRILRYFGIWSALGFGYWVIEERSSGRFVGEAGLADFKRDIVPALDGAPEAGWMLASEFHGKGYAREAMVAALAWFDAARPHTRSVCIISPDNMASLKLAARLGYLQYGVTTYSDSYIVLHQRT